MKRNLFLCFWALTLVFSKVALGEEEFFVLDIPAQSVASALEQLSEQSNSISLFRYDFVASKQSNAVVGRFTLSEALSIMLENTGLTGGLSEKQVISVSALVELDSKTNEDEKLNNIQIKKTTFIAALISAVAGGSAANAQNTDPTTENSRQTLEEVVIVGSRSAKARSAADLAVPVDVIKGDEFTKVGGSVDITDGLRALVPSFTATPLTGDGSSFVRSTSLRGLAADQSLILVNGKRRHRSSLVQFAAAIAGNGSHAPDIAMIPAIALKNVEVLRDGAAAQYGADAIAGVINFELKDADDGGSFEAQYGQHYEGEDNFKIAANGGFAVGKNGFVNVSLEHIDNDGLSRGIQRQVAQDLIDAGVVGVGQDSPYDDAPFVQTWGRPESSGTRLFYNSEFEFDNGLSLYSFGNYADVTGRGRFFFRDPNNSAITGTEALNPSIDAASFLPQGFTPFLDGNQTDISSVNGLRGQTNGGLNWDASIGYGKNELDYFLNNTLNPDLLIGPSGVVQRDFDLGGYEQEEINVNIDFSKAISDTINVAFGAEYRDERFTLVTGEPNASIGRGTSGLSAPTVEAAGTISRSNVAAYVDVEQDVSDRWLIQYALRYEDFDDFGGTLNGKIATRYSLTDKINVRGSLSTGFHAPTPGQANVETVLTTISTNGAGETVLIEQGLVVPTSEIARSVGGTELTEEESTGFSLGFTVDIGSASLTVDGYSIDVDDRIYRTANITTPTGSTISFFTNALDVRSQGIDVVLSDSFSWGGDVQTDYTFAYSYNEFDVTGRRMINGTFPVDQNTVDDIENNYPEHRFVLSTSTQLTDKFDMLVRANYYGKHFDERGVIDGPVGNRSAEIGSTVFVDLELGYQFNDSLKFVLGASNIFDEFPDEILDDGVFANRISVGLQYPRRTPVNYDGGSYYLRVGYDF